jgi:hypothetical protein
MLKFPYGISDFYRVITGNYFYVDRTRHIRLIEDAGEQILFLRPRRFGKTFLLSMLENYYDVAKADEFEQLFGHLAIGQQPTPKHNQYFVMTWDFSAVSAAGDAKKIQQTLYRYINKTIKGFSVDYQAWLPIEIEIEAEDALASFQSLLIAVRQTPYRLYLLIDEYDNFANEVMMDHQASDYRRYDALLYGEGSIKDLFKAVKSASSGRGLERVFIAGVSPVLLNDITSGYNVAKSIYLEPEFNALCGFLESEVEDTLNQIVKICGVSPEKAKDAIEIIRYFYDGYRFSQETDQSVYNPTLALYFFERFQKRCRMPSDMLDNNLAMDRNRIAYISRLPHGKSLILRALDEENPPVVRGLANRFGVEDMLSTDKDTHFMASLLYYLGVLTLGEQTIFGKLIFNIPNLVVRKLYLERLAEMLLPDSSSKEETQQVSDQFYQTGDLEPVCKFIEQGYFKVFNNRDYRWANELTMKTIFLTLLFEDRLYTMISETRAGGDYADLTMILRPDVREQYSQFWDILIEFKFVKLNKLGLSGSDVQSLSRDELAAMPLVQEKLKEAVDQLEGYRQKLLDSQNGAALRLRAFAVVAVGFERLVWQLVPSSGNIRTE